MNEFRSVWVTAVIENEDTTDEQLLMQCSICGPLGVVARPDSDSIAAEHLAQHAPKSPMPMPEEG